MARSIVMAMEKMRANGGGRIDAFLRRINPYSSRECTVIDLRQLQTSFRLADSDFLECCHLIHINITFPCICVKPWEDVSSLRLKS